jgi:hypothetical protein
MSGTWPLARAQIKTIIHGLTVTSPWAETLSAYEYPTAGTQLGSLPYAIIIPASRSVRRLPSSTRETLVDVRVRVYLAGPDGVTAEDLATRYDAWVDRLVLAFDSAIALDGMADIVLEQRFGGLEYFETEKLWGLEMELGDVRITEVITPGA